MWTPCILGLVQTDDVLRNSDEKNRLPANGSSSSNCRTDLTAAAAAAAAAEGPPRLRRRLPGTAADHTVGGDVAVWREGADTVDVDA